MKWIQVLLLAVLGLAVVAPATATAQLNDSQEPGSVLVFPKFIRGTYTDPTVVTGVLAHARTEIEISVVCPKGSTCERDLVTGKFRRVFLRGHWVCPGQSVFSGAGIVCPETSFDLQTTVNGTLYFNPEGVTAVEVPGLPPVITAAAFPSNATTAILPPPCERGYLIVWVTDGDGNAIKGDVLIGNAVIRENFTGELNSARGYNAIPIQASPGLGTLAFTDVDFDRKLDFDGTEYKMVTGKIFGTVRYENEVATTGGDVFTDLTLLTLDVASNRENPLTSVGLNFYTPDEDVVDVGTNFACWMEERLEDLPLVGNDVDLTQQRMGRKGLVESTFAEQNGVPVTLLGLIETREYMGNGFFRDLQRDYAYSLYNDSTPLATTFEP